MKKFFVLCLGLTIAIYFIGSCSASPIYKSMEGEAFAKCKDLCKMCSCSGFSCGNECICECKYKDDQSESIECNDFILNHTNFIFSFIQMSIVLMICKIIWKR